MQKQYSLDNSVWSNYTSPLLMTENGTLYFRGIDAAGNISDITSYEVANIDKVAPEKPTATASTTAPTNQNVTYDFALSGAENNVKLTVYRVDAKTDKKGVTTYSLKSVKSVTATAKNPAVSTGDLCFAADTRYVVAVEAPDAAKAKNSDYTVAMTEKAVFTQHDNESWETATSATGDFDGVLTNAAGGDKLDCFDLSEIGSLALDAGQGKVKVSFFDGNKKAVKVAEMTMADGSCKKNVSTLTLVAGNNTTDSFKLADIGDAVKYLKIEAATNGVNTYKLSLIA